MNPVMRKAIQAGTKANVWLYMRSNGRVGGRGMGRLPLLLLTVSGRKSRTPHTVPVAYFHRNDDYVVVGTGMGGSKETPQRFLNLKAAGKGRIRGAPCAALRRILRMRGVGPGVPGAEEGDSNGRD